MDRLLWLGAQTWISPHQGCCSDFRRGCDHTSWSFLGFAGFIAKDFNPRQLDPASPDAAHLYFTADGNDPSQMAMRIGILLETDERHGQILMTFDDSAPFLLDSDKVQSVVLWDRNSSPRPTQCPSSLMVHFKHIALNIYDGACSITELAERFAIILKANTCNPDSGTTVDDTDYRLEKLLSASRVQMQQYITGQELLSAAALKVEDSGSSRDVTQLSLPLIQASMEMRTRKVEAEKLRQSLLRYLQRYQEEKQASTRKKSIQQIAQLEEQIARVTNAVLDMEIIVA